MKFFSCLICALNPDYVKNILRKAKIARSSLLEQQKIAPDAKSSSNVAECKRERPSKRLFGGGRLFERGRRLSYQTRSIRI